MKKSPKKNNLELNDNIEKPTTQLSIENKPKSLFQGQRIPLLAIFILSLAVYSNTIFHDYALDDQLAIYENKFVTQGIAGIKDILTHDAFVGFFGDRGSQLISGGRYRPLSFISFAIEWQIFGRNPMLSHLINVLLYGILCCSIYLFLSWLFSPKTQNEESTSSESSSISFSFWSIPFMASILYTIHPIHTEVVANIKGRDEILGFLFGALSLIYFFAAFKGRAKDYILLFFLFFLSLMSKENTITFLLVFPLTAWIKRQSILDLNFLKPYAMIFLATIVFLIIRANYTTTAIQADSSEILNNPFVRAIGTEKWGTILFSFSQYFKLLVFPHPLTHDYYFNQIPYKKLSDPFILGIIILLIFLSYITLKAMLKRSPTAYGILFFIITFSIVSNVVFTVGIIMNERFIFISSLGFCIVMAHVLSKYIHQQKIRSLILVLLLIGYSVKTFTRNFAWKDNLTLFSTDYQTSQQSAKVATALGGVLMEQVAAKTKPEDSIHRRIYNDSAISVLLHSIRIYPENSQAWLLYGNAIFSRNMNRAEARGIYLKALSLREGYFDALYNLGLLYFNDGMTDSSIYYMERANKSNPNHRETKETLARLYARTGRTQEAVALGGSSPASLSELALSAKEAGNAAEALSLAEQALKSNPQDPTANYVIGICKARFQNDILGGIPYLEKAISLNNKNGNWLEDLAVAYGMSGQVAKTIPILEEVLRLRPNDPNVYRNLSTTYAKLGNTQKAQYYINLANQYSVK